MPNLADLQVTRALNWVISASFTLMALGFLLVGGVNLYGALTDDDGSTLSYWGFAFAGAAVCGILLWLGWRVLPRAFLPWPSAKYGQGLALRLLLSVVAIVVVLLIPSWLTRIFG